MEVCNGYQWQFAYIGILFWCPCNYHHYISHVCWSPVQILLSMTLYLVFYGSKLSILWITNSADTWLWVNNRFRIEVFYLDQRYTWEGLLWNTCAISLAFNKLHVFRLYQVPKTLHCVGFPLLVYECMQRRRKLGVRISASKLDVHENVRYAYQTLSIQKYYVYNTHPK